MTNHREFDYSNRTLYSIESDAVRYTWAGYCLFVITSSFLGDTTILVASIKHRAFKLHRTIIVNIQHIAFCDLMVAAMDVFPRFVSTIANGWILGRFLCYLTAYGRYYFNTASVLLLCSLTSSKLLLLKYPLRFRVVKAKTAHYFCAACWLVSLTFPVTFLLVDRRDIYSSFRDYQCIFAATLEVWQWVKPIFAIFFLFIPTCLVVAGTIWLLVIARRFARRGRESMKWQGTIAIVLTAAVYCISILPIFMYHIGAALLDVDDESNTFFFINFYRVAISFMSLNTISNFYIYSLTVHSFRRFVLSRILRSPRLSYISSVGTSTSSGQGKRADILGIFFFCKVWI